MARYQAFDELLESPRLPRGQQSQSQKVWAAFAKHLKHSSAGICPGPRDATPPHPPPSFLGWDYYYEYLPNSTSATVATCAHGRGDHTMGEAELERGGSVHP